MRLMLSTIYKNVCVAPYVIDQTSKMEIEAVEDHDEKIEKSTTSYPKTQQQTEDCVRRNP